jgi:hypothetical protein
VIAASPPPPPCLGGMVAMRGKCVGSVSELVSVMHLRKNESVSVICSVGRGGCVYS